MPNFTVSLTDELVDAISDQSHHDAISMASFVRRCVISELQGRGVNLSPQSTAPVLPGRRRARSQPDA